MGSAQGQAKLIDTLDPDYTAHVGGVQEGGQTRGLSGKHRRTGLRRPRSRCRTRLQGDAHSSLRRARNEKAWQASAIRAAARMKNAPSIRPSVAKAPRGWLKPHDNEFVPGFPRRGILASSPARFSGFPRNCPLPAPLISDKM